ncbi:hypothetical protein B5S32_g3497 [[Candida] boidinii]|nr:hypothetical protein B5S32_g3497 [[Candida] boidinii]
MTFSKVDLISIQNAAKIINEKLYAKGQLSRFTDDDKNGLVSSNSLNSSSKRLEIKELLFMTLDQDKIMESQITNNNQDQNENIENIENEATAGISSGAKSNTDSTTYKITETMYDNDKAIINVIYSLLDSIDSLRSSRNDIVEENKSLSKKLSEQQREINRLNELVNTKDRQIIEISSINLKLKENSQNSLIKSVNLNKKYNYLQNQLDDYKNYSIREIKRFKYENEILKNKINNILDRKNRISLRSNNLLSSSENTVTNNSKRETDINKKRKLNEKNNWIEVKENSEESFLSLNKLQLENKNLNEDMTAMYCFIINLFNSFQNFRKVIHDENSNLLELVLEDDNNENGNIISDVNDIESKIAYNNKLKKAIIDTKINNKPLPNSLIPLKENEMLSYDQSLFDLHVLDGKFINLLKHLYQEIYGEIQQNEKISNVDNENTGHDKENENENKNDNKNKKSIKKVFEKKLLSQIQEIQLLKKQKIELENNYDKVLKTMEDWKTFKYKKGKSITDTDKQ